MLNPLVKLNKLRRFASYVSEKIQSTIKTEIDQVDCLFNGDIYTKRDMWEKIDDIANCASLLELRKYDDGEVIIHNGNFCHNAVVCPMCADRVSKRRRAIFSTPLKRAVRRYGVQRGTGDWKSDFPEGYSGVYLATATIKDGKNLKERIDTLLDSLKKFRKFGQKRGGERSGGEWGKVRAGISNVEIKIGSGSGEWHVHAHFLLFVDSPINYRVRDSKYIIEKENGEKLQLSKWNYEWFEATNGEGINFDLEPVEFRERVKDRYCKTFEESVEMQAQEVLKYSTTLSEKKGTGILGAMHYVELIQRRGNRRLFNSLGDLRCDKRNPDSLMTITERELRRQEYIESVDKKCYEIFSSQWQNGGTYGEPIKQDGAIFKSSDDMNTQWKNMRRSAFSAQTAIYQGEYRKSRNVILNSRKLYSDKTVFENELDVCRDNFRNVVNELWKNYGDENFIPEFMTDFNYGGMAEYREKHLKIKTG